MAGVYFYSLSFLIQLATVGTAAQHTQTDPNIIAHSCKTIAAHIAPIPPIIARKLAKK